MAYSATPEQDSDASLVARIAARDQEALSELYDRHKGVVFSLALRILKDRAEAEEALADVFHQAWRTAAGFDARRGTVAGWLIMVCRSRAIDRIRSRGRHEAALTQLAHEEIGKEDAPAGAHAGPEREADQNLQRRRIIRALGSLPAPQRDAIELAYYGGLSHSEIAAKLGEPLGTIKTRIRQGLMSLRESLGREFQP